MLDSCQRRPGFSRWSWSGGQTFPAASWRALIAALPGTAPMPSAATEAAEQALLTQGLGRVCEAAPGAKDFVEKRVLKWCSEVTQKMSGGWTGVLTKRNWRVKTRWAWTSTEEMWLLWSLTGHSSSCQEETWKERVQMEGFTVVWVYLSALQSPCAGSVSLSPISGGVELLSEQISLICPQAGFDLSRCCLLSRWGIKGQCHNCRHLSSTGLLPWQFAYRRKCKQISQEAVWLGNLPEILQASVRLRTSIVFLGIQVLSQCS